MKNDDTEWINEHWNDLRESTDGALKWLGSMPIAIHSIELDPDHIQQLLVKLSDELTALSAHVGDYRPGTEPPQRDDPRPQQQAVTS